MKTATEIAAITKEVWAEKVKSMKRRTENLIENQISYEIEKAAKEGKDHCVFRVEENIDRDLIKQTLENFGFSVTIKGFNINVSWFLEIIK